MSSGDASPPEAQARLLARALACDVELLSRGGSSRTFALVGTGHIVTVPLSWPEPAESYDEVVRRAELQRRIARRVELPVPEVVRHLPELGVVVVQRLEGERLLDAAPAVRAAVRHEVATAVGGLLGDLHTWEPSEYEDVATEDAPTPADWHEEIAEAADALGSVLDPHQRDDVSRFLALPVPGSTPTTVLSHNDLGIEHVLVTTTAGGVPQVAGVIDWDDAAICDPAHDFGLLLRDLGPPALETALKAYAARGGETDGILGRAIFYARCKLLEDLRYGIDEQRPAYVEKSMTGWSEIFGPQAGC